MQNYVKVYYNYYSIWFDPVTGDHDHIACEVCGNKGVEIHHINGRSDESIEALICLCKKCHHEVHFGTELSKGDLNVTHRSNLY